MRTLQILFCALAVAICTWIAGWWSVPVFAVVYTLARRSGAAPVDAAIGTFIAWVSLLLSRTVLAGNDILLTKLGQIFPVPGFAVLVIAALFAMVLAWSAARLALGIVGTKPLP